MAQLKPYPFEQLKKYTEKDALLISRFARFFPACNLASPAVSKLGEALKKYLGPTLEIKYESIFETSYSQFIAGLPDRFVCGVVSLTPMARKAIIEFDPELTFVLIDKLLGGSGEMPKVAHPITPLEEGVIQFLLVKILNLVSDLFPDSHRQFRLDQIISKSSSLALIDEERSPVVLLTMRVKIEKADAYLRICLPLSLLSEMMSLDEAGSEEGAYFFDARLKNFEHLRTVLWAEAGRVSLSSGDVGALERGDIVVFDESYPSLDRKTLSGSLKLRVGEGEHAGIDGLIEKDGEVMKVKVERIFSDS